VSVEFAVAERQEVVVRVVAMARHRSGLPILLTDSRLDNRKLVWAAAHRLGGVPRHSRRFLVVRKPGTTDIEDFDDVLLLWLPGNVRVGDLLSFPCRSRVPVS
jgi:hypothetical protein